MERVKSIKNRVLATLLAVCMVLTMTPAAVFAAEESMPDDVATFVPARLEDHSSSSNVTHDNIIEYYWVDHDGLGENIYEIEIHGDELVYHLNAENKPGWWVGLGVRAPENANCYKYSLSNQEFTTENIKNVDLSSGGQVYSLDQNIAHDEDGVNGFAVYFDADSAEKKSYIALQFYEDNAAEKAAGEPFYLNIDYSGVNKEFDDERVVYGYFDYQDYFGNKEVLTIDSVEGTKGNYVVMVNGAKGDKKCLVPGPDGSIEYNYTKNNGGGIEIGSYTLSVYTYTGGILSDSNGVMVDENGVPQKEGFYFCKVGQDAQIQIRGMKDIPESMISVDFENYYPDMDTIAVTKDDTEKTISLKGHVNIGQKLSLRFDMFSLDTALWMETYVLNLERVNGQLKAEPEQIQLLKKDDAYSIDVSGLTIDETPASIEWGETIVDDSQFICQDDTSKQAIVKALSNVTIGDEYGLMNVDAVSSVIDRLYENAEENLSEANQNGDTVYDEIRIETYLNVTPLSYDAEEKTLSMEIMPYVRAYAVDQGDAGDESKLLVTDTIKPEGIEQLEQSDGFDLWIGLPNFPQGLINEGVVDEEGYSDALTLHRTNGKEYLYILYRDEREDETIEYTIHSKYGFGTFIFGMPCTAAEARWDLVYFPTLQGAVDAFLDEERPYVTNEIYLLREPQQPATVNSTREIFLASLDDGIGTQGIYSFDQLKNMLICGDGYELSGSDNPCWTQSPESDKWGALFTFTKSQSSSDNPIAPSTPGADDPEPDVPPTTDPETSDLVFADSTQEKQLESCTTGNEDLTLNLEADYGEELTDWTYETTDKNVVKVLKNGKIRFMGVGDATITVTAVGKTSGKVYSIEIPVSVKKPGKPTYILKNKISKKEKTFTVTSSTVRGADGFQVQYSLKNLKKTRKGSRKTSFKVGKKMTREVVKTNKSNRKYYVRVRAYQIVSGKRVYSEWSSVNTVKSR